MGKTFEEWCEVKNETISDISTMLKPGIADLCPPVIIALDILRIPQAGIAAVLKTKQPRISLFRQGKAKMNISEQERACDLVEAMIEKVKADLPHSNHKIHPFIESGDVQDGWKDMVKVQIEYAQLMNKIQRAIIQKEKEAKR